MAVFKDKRFTATATWVGGTRARVNGPDLPGVDVATPAELGGRGDDVWSPEELLLAACASCYELTVVAVARSHSVPVHAVQVAATGHVTRRDDGLLGFIVLEIDAKIVTDRDRVADAGVVAERAKDACITMLALEVPVHIRVGVKALEPAAVTTAA